MRFFILTKPLRPFVVAGLLLLLTALFAVTNAHDARPSALAQAEVPRRTPISQTNGMNAGGTMTPWLPAWPPPPSQTPETASPRQVTPRQNLRRAVQDVTYPVLEHPASQESPRIADHRVVWQDARYGPTDIFMKDLETGVIENATTSGTWEVLPDIDADVIVWKDGYNGIGIHGVDLSSGEVFTVTEQQHDVSKPRISGNVVVWADDRRGDWNVYGYDRATGTEFVISDAPGDQRDPNVDGKYVVWWDNRHGDDYNDHIYAYDLTTKLEIPVATNAGDKERPDVAGNLVVWLDARNGAWDIYAYDLSTKAEQPLVTAEGNQRQVVIGNGLVAWQDDTFGTWDVYLHDLESHQTFPLTRNPGLQTMPAIGDNRVVWQDNRNHQWDIFGFTWNGIPPPEIEFPLAHPGHLQAGSFPEGKIRLAWEDNSQDEDGFRIERARAITGTDWVDLVTLPANTMVYTDTPGILDESFWYRVQAFNASGHSAYSNESFNSTFQMAPNLDEMYMLVLINEARADPGAFGYPAYPAVPPLAYNALLNYSAHSQSQSILNSDAQFGHCDPAGRCPTGRARAVGYSGECGENLILGGDGPSAVAGANQAFMDSEGHRNNMLAPDLLEAGIGHAYDPARGSIWHGQYTEVLCGRAGVTRPVLPSGAVVPYTGTLDTDFTYVVNFYSADGYAPSTARVYIDGTPHEMALSTGTAVHGTYRYTTTLALGYDHHYYFQFEYGPGLSARWPQSGSMDFPDTRPYRPNLSPTEPWSNNLVVGYEGTISSWIRNSGEVAAENVAVEFYLGNPQAGGTQIGATQVITRIEPNENQSVEVTWTPTMTGEHTFYVWTDPDNAITEVDESNNLLSGTISVREADLTWYVDHSVDVSGDGRTPGTAFKTIGEAVPHALRGNTIQVTAGTYVEQVSVPTGVALIGAGLETTTLDGGGKDGPVVRLSMDSTVEGFTIRNSGPDYFDCGVWLDHGTAVLRGNHITGNAAGILAWCFDEATCDIQLTIENNIVDGNSFNGINSNSEPVLIVRNNTVVGNEGAGILLNNRASQAVNNIVVSNSQGVVNYAGAAVHHNDVWGNEQNYAGGESGEGGLSMDPMFRDRENGDYRLYAGSPAVGRGAPDGTTDMGALPFDPTGIPPSEVEVQQIDSSRWRVSWEDTGAAGYNLYIGTLTGFYDQRIDAGPNTSHVLEELPPQTHYIAVSSYDKVGAESAISQEVAFSDSPPTSTPTPTHTSTPTPTSTYTPTPTPEAGSEIYLPNIEK